MNRADDSSTLQPYLPRLLGDWQTNAPDTRWQEIAASTVFVDVSGFTKMSERLARQGRVGAEEVTEVIDNTFGRLLGEAYAYGGSLLKFGGDALFLLFTGDDHPARAAAAAHGMRSELRRIGTFTTTAGQVTLRMSVGAHTDTFHLFLVGGSHRELIVAGPGATTLTRMEEAASAGQILMSPALAAMLPRRNRGREVGPGVLLARDVEAERSGVDLTVPETDLTEFIPDALRETVRERNAGPEHRSVTVAFIHFSQFDEFLISQGPATTAEALDELVGAVQQAVDGRGVAFLATDLAPDGGKIILTAGAPNVTGEDEELMLLALRDVVSLDYSFPLEIGVNRGSVFAGEIGPEYRRTYTVMGDAVNLAARLMARAESGQVLTTQDVLAGSRTTFDTTELEPFRVKGKSEPVQAFVVGGPTGSRGQVTESGLPLIGRNDELNVLVDAWNSARTGQGMVVELQAEAGMGKSRLLEEFLAQADVSRYLSTECRLYQSTSHYFPFRALLRQALGLEGLGDRATITGLEALVRDRAPELEPWLALIGVVLNVSIPESDEVSSLEDEFRRARVEESVESLLAALLTDPVVIAVEDTHWMDEASRDLMLRLTAVRHRPWLLILSRRPGDDGFVAPEEPGSIVSIPLAPLGIEEASTVINSASEANPLMPRQVKALAERAHGNPLFLIELLDALQRGEDVEALPQSVEGLIQARIDRLSPADRSLLRRVSVLGAGFQAEHVAAVLPGTTATGAVKSLRRLSDFLSFSETGWVHFRHELIRNAAYEGLPYRTRQRLHSQIGDSLRDAAGGRPEDEAELLSIHYFLARRWPEAWAYNRIAGDDAKAIYSNLDAARFYERALRAGRELDRIRRRERADVWTTLGDVRELSGLFDESLAAYRRASILVGDDRQAKADLFLKRARARMHAGSYRAALSEITRGQRLLESNGAPSALTTRARLTALRALIRQAQQRASDALVLAERAVVEAGRAGDDVALARSYMTLDWAHRILGRPEAAVNAPEALAIYERLGDLDGAADVMNNLGAVAYLDGRWDDAIDLYFRAQEAWLRAGNEVRAAVAGSNIGELLVSQRRFDEAEPILAEASRVFRASNAVDDGLFTEIQIGRLLGERGDHEDAIELLGALRAEALTLGQTGYALEAAIHLAGCIVAEGDGREALELLESAQDAAGGEDPVYAPTLERVRGLALAELKQFEDALDHLDVGLTEARRQGLAYEEALLVIARRQVTRQWGQAGQGHDADVGPLLDRLGVRI